MFSWLRPTEEPWAQPAQSRVQLANAILKLKDEIETNPEDITRTQKRALTLMRQALLLLKIAGEEQ